MKEYIRICTDCGTETTDSYCHECMDYKGLVEGYYDASGEFIEEEER